MPYKKGGHLKILNHIIFQSIAYNSTCNHHHHHLFLLAKILQTPSLHTSLTVITVYCF